MSLTAHALRFFAIVGIGAAVFIVTRVMASRPSRVASRLGLRGLKRQRVTQDNALWRALEPFVRWLGVRISGLVTPTTHAKVERMLALGGSWMGVTPDEFFALSIVSAVGGGIVGTAVGIKTGLLAIGVVGLGLGAMLPYLALTSEIQRRQRQITQGLPYVLDLLSLAMSAGKDFPGAVREVIEKSSDPTNATIEELSVMLRELQLGQTRRRCLEGLMERAPLDCVTEFSSSIIQAEDRGNPVARVLDLQAKASRQQRTIRAEEGAAKAGVAMVGPLFLLFFAVMILIIAPIAIKAMSGE